MSEDSRSTWVAVSAIGTMLAGVAAVAAVLMRPGPSAPPAAETTTSAPAPAPVTTATSAPVSNSLHPTDDLITGTWVVCYGSCTTSAMDDMPAGMDFVHLLFGGSANHSDTFTASNGSWRIDGDTVFIQLNDMSWRGLMTSNDCLSGYATYNNGRQVRFIMARDGSHSASHCWAPFLRR